MRAGCRNEVRHLGIAGNPDAAEVCLCPHALLRMKERGISIEAVEAVLREPAATEPRGHLGSTFFSVSFQTGYLRAVLRPCAFADHLCLVTAIYRNRSAA